jgi:hypothetical protein
VGDDRARAPKRASIFSGSPVAFTGAMNGPLRSLEVVLDSILAIELARARRVRAGDAVRDPADCLAAENPGKLTEQGIEPDLNSEGLLHQPLLPRVEQMVEPVVQAGLPHVTILGDQGYEVPGTAIVGSVRHHHAKHAPGWHLQQTRPGVMRWTTPSGRTYTTHPTQYLEE